MSGESIFLLVIGVLIGALLMLAAFSRARELKLWGRRSIRLLSGKHPTQPSEHALQTETPDSDDTSPLSAEESSEAELAALQDRIEKRIQIARDTDLCHHLWGFYKILFRNLDPDAATITYDGDEWYDVKIADSRNRDGLVEFDFEMLGERYTIGDDEERHGWCETTKQFSLFLQDENGHCLIEVPMKLKVNRDGRTYSIGSGGPVAFLPGDWVHEFIRVKLKHERIRNQDIRSQKHQERLWEIQELKERFGISD